MAGAAYARSHQSPDNTDYEQSSGSSQPFVRQANEERSGFENRGFGSQERRPNNERERSDNANEGGSFSSRDRERL